MNDVVFYSISGALVAFWLYRKLIFTLRSKKVKEKLAQGAKVVDVRSQAEYQGGHYARAINIPVDQIERRVKEFADKNAPLILYCASGTRSAVAARAFKQAGFSDVINAGSLYNMPD